MTIDTIKNGEIGYDARSKMNSAIVGVNDLESIVDVEASYFTTTTPTDNTYVITPQSSFTIKIGTTIRVRFNAANTNSGFTLNFDNKGAFRCYKNLTESLPAGEIHTNGIYLVMYTGDAWSIIGTVATIIDNLTDSSTTKVLSANQGKVLGERVSAVEDIIGDHETDISNLQTTVTSLIPISLNDVEIPQSSWEYSATDNLYIANISVPGATYDDFPHVGFKGKSYSVMMSCGINAVYTEDDLVVIYAEAAPPMAVYCDIWVEKKPV